MSLLVVSFGMGVVTAEQVIVVVLGVAVFDSFVVVTTVSLARFSLSSSSLSSSLSSEEDEPYPASNMESPVVAGAAVFISS